MTKAKEEEKIISSLNKDVLKVNESLNKIFEDISKIDNGDNTYWKGKDAYSSLKLLINQYHVNKNIICKLEKILENYE